MTGSCKGPIVDALCQINFSHEAHGRSDLLNESHFKILRKRQGKFDCLVFEVLYGFHTCETLWLTCKLFSSLLVVLVFIYLSFSTFFDLTMTLW